MNKLFVIGAGSDIALETSSHFKNIDEIYLVTSGADIDLLNEKYCKKMVERPKKVESFSCPVFDSINATRIADYIVSKINRGDNIKLMFASGYMDNDGLFSDVDSSLKLVNVNFLFTAQSICSVLESMNKKTKKEVPTQIHFITFGSVSGARGKLNTLFYSSAKAALEIFMEGLYCVDRINNIEIAATLVKPGFVKTKMLQKKKTPGLLTVDVKQAGLIIAKGIEKKKTKIYTQTLWFFIINLFKILPLSIWKKISTK